MSWTQIAGTHGDKGAGTLNKSNVKIHTQYTIYNLYNINQSPTTMHNTYKQTVPSKYFDAARAPCGNFGT